MKIGFENKYVILKDNSYHNSYFILPSVQD